jgi:alanyl-tRNA synthetase
MAREAGLSINTSGFEKLMSEQRDRARSAQKKEIISVSSLATEERTEFVGFDIYSTKSKVVEVLKDEKQTAVVLDRSPFYAEMGGQLGDTGVLIFRGQELVVSDTQKVGDAFLHVIKGKEAPAEGSEVELRVDVNRRAAIQRHHTVTHLFHWALHEVTSPDCTQKGSFVGPEKLTFDFNSQPLTSQQLCDIEELVNERILENASVSWVEVSYSDIASRDDILQFFGDKYGDKVRVVQIGGQPNALDGYSMELCGGTHVSFTGELGLFRIQSESAVAAGVRRIEAVAGLVASRQARSDADRILAIADQLNTPVRDLEKKIISSLEQTKKLEKELKTLHQSQAASQAKALLDKIQVVNGVNLITANLGSLEGDQVQSIVDALKAEFNGVIVLGSGVGSRVALVASVSEGLIDRIQAGKIIQTIAPIVGGKGGGNPSQARGGGKDTSKIDEALSQVIELI